MTWTRINKTIERNLLMVDSYKNQLNNKQVEQSGTDESKIKNVKPQDIVRLYDIIIQNYRDMANLPGLQYDKQFQNDSELFILFNKTFRAYYISLFYLAIKKYKESIGFCFKVDGYIKEAEAALVGLDSKSEMEKSKQDDMKSELKQLRTELEQFKYKLQTEALLENGLEELSLKDQEVNKEKLEKIPLVDRMDIYFEDNNLLNNNPNVARLALNFEPVQCKPLFFDLALNHVELPSFEDKIDSKKATQQQQQQGVKGFIKGIFGFN